MPQPYFTNSTPIARMDTRLAGSIGDRFAAGLQQAAEGFAAGIERKKLKDEQKKKDDQALLFMQRVAPQLGLDPNDTETLKAGIEGMGGADRALQVASQIKQIQQQQTANQIQQRQLEELTRSIRDNRIDRNAAQTALGGINQDGVTARDLLGTYAGAGGNSIRTAGDLAEIGRAIAPRNTAPQLMDFGGGIRGVVDPNGNTHMIPQPGTTGGSSAFERILANQVARGKISPEKADKLTLDYLERMSSKGEGDLAETARMLGIDPAEMNGSTGSPQAAAPTAATPAATPTISTKDQYDSLPPGTRFIGPDGKEYEKPKEPEKKKPKGLSDLVTGG